MDARLFPLGEYSKEVARNTCVQAFVENIHFCFSKIKAQEYSYTCVLSRD